LGKGRKQRKGGMKERGEGQEAKEGRNEGKWGEWGKGRKQRKRGMKENRGRAGS
jgi:hypothetical protein